MRIGPQIAGKSKKYGFEIPIPWAEFFVEKTIRGEISSKDYARSANGGLRFDSELVYPIYTKWYLIPGINYYRLKDEATDYSYSVFETRLVFAREFEF